MRNAETLKNEGNARRSTGDLQGALESYRGALELDPDYAPAIYNLGVVLQEFGRLGEAEQCFRRFHGLAPSDRDGAFRLGLVLAEQERYADASQAYRSALRVDADNPLLWLELGKACRALHQGGEALSCASRAVAIDPALAEAHNLLGMLLQDEGSTERAIEHYRKAVALAGDDPAYHNNLGCALGLKGALDESVASLRRAVQLRPEYMEAQTNLANMC